MGLGKATTKSVLQCNVGNKSPVFLCSLYPEKTESLQLNLEFEEVDEVIFSVIGPRSIHLSGYYLGGGGGGGRYRALIEESYPLFFFFLGLAISFVDFSVSTYVKLVAWRVNG